MKRHPLSLLIAVIALSAVLVTASPAAASSHWKHIATTTHWTAPTDTFVTFPPCDPVTSKSPEGICRGTATGTATNTDGWKGTTKYAYTWAYSPKGVTYIQSIETFTGKMRGCGRGTLTYLLTASVSPSGALFGSLTMVPALGTGGLTGVHGQLSVLGKVNPDYSNEGDFYGHVTCRT